MPDGQARLIPGNQACWGYVGRQHEALLGEVENPENPKISPGTGFGLVCERKTSSQAYFSDPGNFPEKRSQKKQIPGFRASAGNGVTGPP